MAAHTHRVLEWVTVYYTFSRFYITITSVTLVGKKKSIVTATVKEQTIILDLTVTPAVEPHTLACKHLI